MSSTYMNDFSPPNMRLPNCKINDKLKIRRKQRRHFRATKSELSNRILLDDSMQADQCNKCDQQEQDQFELSNISEGEWTAINRMGRLIHPQLIPWQATPEQNTKVQRIVDGVDFKYLTPDAVAADIPEDEVKLTGQNTQQLKDSEVIKTINEQLNSATQSVPRQQYNDNSTNSPWNLHLQGQPKENWPYELEHYYRLHQRDCSNDNRISQKHRNVPIYYRIGIPDLWQLQLRYEEQKCQ